MVLDKWNHWSCWAGFDVFVTLPSGCDWENSVTRRAKGFVLFSNSMAETRVPLLALLLLFWRRAIKFSFRELDLGVVPRPRVRRSVLLLFTGETRHCLLPKESVGSLRPRTFLFDLGKPEQYKCIVKVYTRVPQIWHWSATAPQSLSSTLIKDSWASSIKPIKVFWVTKNYM